MEKVVVVVVVKVKSKQLPTVKQDFSEWWKLKTEQ